MLLKIYSTIQFILAIKTSVYFIMNAMTIYSSVTIMQYTLKYKNIYLHKHIYKWKNISTC